MTWDPKPLLHDVSHVGATLRGALEALERGGVPVHERVQIIREEDVEVLRRAVGENVERSSRSC